MFAGVGTSAQGAQAGRAHTQPGLTIGRGTHSSSVPTRWFCTSLPDVFAGVGTSAHGLHPLSGPFIEGDLEDDNFEVDDDPVQDVLGSPLVGHRRSSTLTHQEAAITAIGCVVSSLHLGSLTLRTMLWHRVRGKSRKGLDVMSRTNSCGLQCHDRFMLF